MIISHSSLGGNGRLGNQLFQIAGTLGLAEKYGAIATFPAWKYESYFENELPHGHPTQQPLVDELYFHHYDWNLTSSCDLRGYLQSEKYFGSTKLKLKQEFVEQSKEKYHELFQRPVICVQVRRGDYVGNKNYYQLPITYYIDALLTFFSDWKQYNLLILSDDIDYCKLHFGCLPNAYFTEGIDIEDMALASLCDHFIISNSTFGWWCAWLGEKATSKIIHSGYLFAGAFSKKITTDYRPTRWIEHHKSEYKLDLRDLTFTIPIHYDHQNRKENLDLILYLLQSTFHSNYIICEQGGNTFVYTSQWATYLKSDSKHFHRTKMLNDMCNKAVTPYLANLDCDVIIPPMQLYYAVERLREGADMIYPYDGRFARMPRAQWYPALQSSFDIGVVKGQHFKGLEPEHNSVGGAVLWNKEAFIDGGMENEYFISFGPEDGERNDRFKTLGYDVQRVRGALYHLNHFVGNDSSPRNPYFQQNVLEQQKVHGMDKEQLRAYVDTWPWRHQYTDRYYHKISKGAIHSAGIVMKLLGREFKHVIDIGCGVGEWNNGNPNYIGVDYRIDKSKLLIPVEHYVECDLNREFPTPSGKKYDLCLCLEVAEHLKPSRAEPLVEYLCSLSDTILFSAAIPYQGGQGHVNEQWQSWWAELFYKQGFGTTHWELLLREEDCSEVEPWYRQNIVLYERGAKGRVVDFVLPEYYLQIVKGLSAK